MNNNSSNNISDNNDNKTFFDPSDLEYMMRLQQTTGIICVVFPIWIILANALIIITILSSASLRTQLRNQLILNICFVNLLQGIIFYPFYGHHSVHSSIPSCEFGIVMYMSFVHTDIFLEMWLLVTQDLLYLTKQLSLDLPVLSNRALVLVKVFWNGLPWVMAFVVIMPIVFAGFDQSIQDICLAWKHNSTRVHAAALSFFLPAAVILVLIVCFTVFHTCAKPRARVAEENLLGGPSGLEHPICYIAPSLVAVLSPLLKESYHVFRNTTSFSYYFGHAKLMFQLYTSGTLIDLAKCGILPLTWLLLPDVRAAMMDLWKSLRGARSRWSELHTVSYTKDEESQ